MRGIIISTLKNDATLQADLGERWVSSSGLDAADEMLAGMERPFGVVRLTGTYPGVSSSVIRGCEVWIHDEPGSYVLIDRCIRRVKDLLLNTVQVRNEMTGGWLQQVGWNNDSPDLFDDVRRTNTKMTSLTLVGSGD